MSTFLLIVCVAIGLYFIPTIIAMVRHKQNTMAIFALNLFLGWTLLGFVVALVWALTKDRDIQAITIVNPPGEMFPPNH